MSTTVWTLAIVGDASTAETTATALAQGMQRTALTSATAGSTGIAEATGISRAATSKGTVRTSATAWSTAAQKTFVNSGDSNNSRDARKGGH